MDNSRQGVTRHNDFIRRHGDWVWYYPSAKCPCESSVERPLITCPYCKGTGILHLERQEIRGIMADIKMDKQLLNSGIASPGDMAFSQEIGRIELTEWDMLKMQVPQPYEGQLVTRGAGLADTLWYDIGEVQHCLYIDPIAKDLTEYTRDVDFTAEGKVVSWLGDNRPAQGKRYSIKYTAYFEWIVFLPPTLRVERGTNLGQRVVLRKRHIALGTQ